MNRSPWLITGAGGFIGRPTLEALRRLEPERQTLRASRQGDGDIRIDLCAPTLSLPKGIDTLIHLAGEKRDESRMWQVNLEGTRKLLEAAARAGVRRFVYVSSVGVYGIVKGAAEVDERQRPAPANPYEASKSAAESCVHELCSRHGVEHVVLQPSNVIGHVSGRSYPLLTLMSAIRSGRFAYVGTQDSWVNYIDVSDVAFAIVSAARGGKDGATYILNTPARLADLVGWISEGLGVPAPARRIPAWLGLVGGSLGSAAQRLTGRAMPFNAERLRELTSATRYDGSAAVRDLELRYPTGIENAVRALVAAYRAEGVL
jgi:nucleoside-diphosphate-sugar epimerase